MKGAQPQTHSLIREKPSAFKTNIAGIAEALGFRQQEQIRDGWAYLGQGAFKRKIN